MAVSQRTLNWLYSVLRKDHYDPKQTYQDPNRAYHDVANALAQYPSLAPRTDVYTFENGFSALLLHLVGTLPVTFRGTTYRFPIALWIPNTYPREPPIVYVTPTQDMAVRVGQHVTLEGRVYHHYLARWAEAWDRATISDLLMILREVFAKEPPVRNRQQMLPHPQTQQTQTPPPLPPLPPGMGPSSTPQAQPPSTAPMTQTPPQLPPKPGAATVPQQLPAQTAERYQSPPPLPPLPPKDYNPSRTSSLSHASMTSPSGLVPHQFAASPHPVPQNMPPTASQSQAPHGRNSNGLAGPFAGPQQTSFARQPGPPVPYISAQQPPHFSQVPPSHYAGYPPRSQQSPGPPYPTDSPHPSSFQRPPPAASAPKEMPDLLTSPFEVELPSFAPTRPAPPIPPNPEKDALLHALSQTLAETLQAQATQSDTASQSLVSQSRSLQATMATLQGELTALNSLHATLQSNTAVLQQSIQRADATIADAQARSASVSSSAASTSASAGSSDPPSGLPPIDEVLVAPTVVGKQLYDLVAEEQGLQHALYALQTALARGVIGVDSWSRHTRGLAREAFLKRALIRKIGRGMGLEENEA
ncbi:Nucleic acid-binding OB-fold [Penicillium atrosanguineum]|uniref:Endosomal sorting complex protein TSG101 n=1 Tax=Penicillium atrosanguineum TaxID=1132637 RepID=A0A9W9U045_9EURO|nr:Nucleic acid-binding OB-fold [Penicillium atrosanguineum]KAJ5297226.1 Nucleic acid-binding OB-fold [Penicillium atrosanguineum]KAJ5299988.1 hypothetical protein N7476_011545 [Penicillium atrosanguineum]